MFDLDGCGASGEIAYHDEAVNFDCAHVAFSPGFVIAVSDFEAEPTGVESHGLFDIGVGQDDSDSRCFRLRAVVEKEQLVERY